MGEGAGITRYGGDELFFCFAGEFFKEFFRILGQRTELQSMRAGVYFFTTIVLFC